MGCIVIKLNTVDSSMREGRRLDTWYFAASINPRQEGYEMLIAIGPRKQPRQTISIPPPTVGEDENFWVASFNGSEKMWREHEA